MKIKKQRQGMNILTATPVEQVQSSTFNMSKEVLTTSELGTLNPMWFYEVLPGDNWSISQAELARLAPMIAPQYSDVDVKKFCLFVPYRLLWANQDDFQNWWMGRSSDNEFGNGEPPAAPYFTYPGGCVPGTVGNYMGIPNDVGPDSIELNPLPIAAYKKAYDDWFRPQLFKEPSLVPIVPGENPAYATLAVFDSEKIGWAPDLFTAGAPTPQLGQSVMIPLLDPDLGNPSVSLNPALTSGTYLPDKVRHAPTGNLSGATSGMVIDSSGDWQTNNVTPVDSFIDPQNLVVRSDEINIVANTIDTLRTAFKMQRYFEALLRVGTRFVDYLRGIWNVESSDARLQNAELLNVSSNAISISEVVATADTVNGADGSPLGTLAGHGISADASGTYTYFAEEPGIIIGLYATVPRTYYYQGIDPAFLRKSYLDYPIPHLDNIGEEPIPLCELYADVPAEDHFNTFAYRPRNSRWKSANNMITGEFQTTMDYFHFGRKFDDAPVLDATFIEATVPQRPFAVQGPDVHHVWYKIVVKAWVKRRLSAFSTPSLNPGS